MTSPVPSSGDAGLVERLRKLGETFADNADDAPNVTFSARAQNSLSSDCLAAADLIESLTQQQEQVEVRAWEYDTGDEWDLTADEAKAARLSEIIPVQPLIRLTDHQAIVSARGAEIERLRDAYVRARDAAQAAERKVEELTEALTPSADTKAAYAGEFYMGVRLSAGGEEGYRCVQIPWTTIKEIMGAIRARATLNGGAK